MAIRKQKIEKVANEILERMGIQSPKVNVRLIAQKLGLQVRLQALEDSSISGFLYRDGESCIIGVNASQAPVRQRFTIAHEIGHYLLHGSLLHVDRSFVHMRDNRASEGTHTEEIEANTFAACLLMPQDFLALDVERFPGLDISGPEFEKLARDTYGVSPQALTLRLTNLGFISEGYISNQ